MKKYIKLFSLFLPILGFGQMSATEYLAWVKTEHPVVKQANLTLNAQEAKLLKARGGLDPVVKVRYSDKQFDDKQYYQKFYSSFEVPTQLGLVFSAAYEDNQGEYLNPESLVPESGLLKIGVSMEVFKNLVYNPRNATLKKAKIYQEQSIYQQGLEVNAILKEALDAYIMWYSAYQAASTFNSYIEVAQLRYNNIAEQVNVGNLAAIDLTEAEALLNQRQLSYEKAQLHLTKTRLLLSNYLWKEGYPISLKESMSPNPDLNDELDEILDIPRFTNLDSIVENHPKIKSLDLKQEALVVDQKLAVNNILPSVDVSYNYLMQGDSPAFDGPNYQGLITAKIPILMRKERGDLKLAKIKTENFSYSIDQEKWQLKNKLEAILAEISSYERQVNLSISVRDNYQTLTEGEWEKYQAGEGTLLYVNIREGKSLESSIKLIDNTQDLFFAKSKLYEQQFEIKKPQS